MARFERTYVYKDVLGYYEFKRGWVSNSKSKTRYSFVNPYDHVIIELRNSLRPLRGTQYGGWVNGFNRPNALNLATNKAYARLVESLRGDSASLGNAIGEWRSSVDMIARRAITIRRAWKKVRALDPFGAIQELAIPDDTKRKLRKRLVRKEFVRPGSKRGHMRVRRDKFVSTEHYLSSMWLEMYFGFLPLMGDIHDSLAVLSDPIRRPVKVYGSGSTYVDVNDRVGTARRNGRIIIRVRSGCDVRVTNPNLHLATRMGLTNPAAIAWELVPFSFVVDWFTNVGQMVESLTDFAGLSISNGWTSYKSEGSGALIDVSAGGTIQDRYSVTHTEFKRVPSVVSPRFAIRNPLGDWKRAATQVSLLVQLFVKPR